MIVAPAPTPEATPQPPPQQQQQHSCAQSEYWRNVAEQERAGRLEAEARERRGRQLQSAQIQVLDNSRLLPADRIYMARLVTEQAYQRQKQGGDDPVVNLAMVATSTGVGPAVATRCAKTLQSAGVIQRYDEREHIDPTASEVAEAQQRGGQARGHVRTHTHIRQERPIHEALEIIAQLDPERPEWGGRRVRRIRPECPVCHSDHTSLECLACGLTFSTADLLAKEQAEADARHVTLQDEESGEENGGADPTAAVTLKNCEQRYVEPSDSSRWRVTKNSPTESTEGAGADRPQVVKTVTLQDEESRPAWLAPKPGHMPQPLLHLPQWVFWRAEWRDGKWTKPPLDPRTGKPASVSDPTTWGTIHDALDGLQRHGGDGVGFIFTAGDPFATVDLDTLDDDARAIIRALDSYTEHSPSGRGAHVIVKASKPAGGCRRGTVEIYDQARFLTITGHRIDGSPATIRERQDELAAVHAALFPPAQAAAPQRPHVPARADDDAVIERLCRVRSNAGNLWRGDTVGYPSKSEADWALLGHLYNFTDGDGARMHRLFLRSGLYDPTDWDRPDGHGTHGEAEVQRLVNLRTGADA